MRFRDILAGALCLIPAAGMAQDNLIPDYSQKPSIEVKRALEETSPDLFDALLLAYDSNPTLRAARAELEALEERLPQARAGFLPNIEAGGDITAIQTDSEGNSLLTQDGTHTSKGVGLDINQPIFRGGQTIANVNAAQNLIAAGTATLERQSQSILLDGATAYMNVLRDEALLALAENNREVIARQLEAAQARFDVGELTKTDVSQAQARLAAAEADIVTVRGTLRGSQALYEEIIGLWPNKPLTYPEERLELPTSLEEVLVVVQDKNPGIVAAEYTALAAEDTIDSVFAELLPRISLLAGVDKAYDPQPGFLDEQDTSSIGISATIPLYQGGATRSRVREAKMTANQRRIQILETRRGARAEAIASWEQLKAAKATIQSRKSQLEASAIAREGVQYETEFGERTVLDTLNADQEYLDAQVALVSARRDEIIARYRLAAALGLLTPENLGLAQKVNVVEDKPQ